MNFCVILDEEMDDFDGNEINYGKRDFKNPNNWISNAYYTEIEPTN